MVPVWVLAFSLAVIYVHGNIEGDYCEVVEEYDKFKVSLDNFLASRDEVCNKTNNRIDCASIKDEFPEATDGVYRIKPNDGKPSFLAYCDMTEQRGGWLVIQRRQDGSEDFFRNWFEYMDGFGDLMREFWLGNEKIHRLASQGNYTLRIDLEMPGKTAFAEYNHFLIGDMSEFYSLTISGFSGNTGTEIMEVDTQVLINEGVDDSLKYHNKFRFSAKNLNLDNNGGNCARIRHGAWWYNACRHSNLNGLYTGNTNTGMYWMGFGISKKTTMKIRPTQ